MQQITPVVKNLLILNVLMYVITWFFQNQGLDLSAYLAVFYLDSPYFKIWQPITYMFMHGSLMHIFFNMFALFSFGSVLEQHWGGKKFLNFYLLTGLGALLLQWGVQAFEVYQVMGSALNSVDQVVNSGSSLVHSIYGTRMLGASGAIFGILVAFAMLYPNVQMFIMFIPVPVKAKYIIPVYIVIELMLGLGNFAGDSVAHFAHLGGALIGYFLVKRWRNSNTFYDYYE